MVKKKEEASEEEERYYYFGEAALRRRKRKDYNMCARCNKTKADCDCGKYESVQPFIAQVDRNYSLNLEIAETIVHALQLGDHVMLVGPPGCGKSTIVEMISAITDWEMIRFSCSEETRHNQIIGQWIVTGDKMRWVDGYVTDAFRNGKILLEDEADFMRPELRGALHPLLEKGGYFTLQNYHPQTGEPFMEIIRRHEDFRWVSTANTTGLGDDSFLYHGTQFMNAAARDRYSLIVKMGYLSQPEEQEIIMAKTMPHTDSDGTTYKLDPEIAAKMCKVAAAVREFFMQQKIQYQFSLRRLISWAQYHTFYQGRKPQRAVETCVLGHARDDDVPTLVNLIKLECGHEFVVGLE